MQHQSGGDELKTIMAALDAQGSILSAIATRLADVHEQCRRTNETVTRLKLMADNARVAASAQDAALAKITQLIADR